MFIQNAILFTSLFSVINIRRISSQSLGNSLDCSSQSRNIFEVCSEGFSLNGRPFETCTKQCPGLIGIGVQMGCWYSGKTVDCSRPAAIDTEVRVRCKPGYVPSGTDYFFRAFCQSNGVWSQQLYSCVPECGLLSPGLSLEDTDSTIYVPWQTYIYHGALNDPIGQGSIIGPRAILTAANRVFRLYRPDVGATDTSEFEIIVGKRHYNNRTLVEPHAQAKKIIKILASEIFEGYRIRLNNDYAILILDSEIEFSDEVMPVCLRNLKDLPIPTEGYVILMGRKYAEKESLYSRKLEIYTRFKCLNMIDGSDRFLPSDKLCALTYNTKEDYGLTGYPDVGPSLTVLEEKVGDRERHHLIGVLGNGVSSKNTTERDGKLPDILAFVNLSVSSTDLWLRNSQDEIHRLMYCNDENI